MAQTVGDVLWDRLSQRGVRQMFGLGPPIGAGGSNRSEPVAAAVECHVGPGQGVQLYPDQGRCPGGSMITTKGSTELTA